MTRSHTPTRHSPAQVEAAAAWVMRVTDGPLADADQAALDAWQAEAPANAAAFAHAEAVWHLFDDPHGVPSLDALRVEAYARTHPAPHAKD